MKRPVRFFSSWFNRDPFDDPSTVGGKFANKKMSIDDKLARFFQKWASYPLWLICLVWIVLPIIAGVLVFGVIPALLMHPFGPLP